MEYLGVIPARGGSKGVPRKNIRLLSGRPLLAFTCHAALESRGLGRVILSTEDAEIAAVGRGCGVEVPFLRPPELARDETSIRPVLLHLLKRLEEESRYVPDAVVLLQPTSPLRTASHIDEALIRFERSDADGLVSVMEVPHHFSPTSLMVVRDAWLESYETGGGQALRRQEKPVVFARNGPAILIRSVASLRALGGLYDGRVLPYWMNAVSSIDIDSEVDLLWAEFLLSRGVAEVRPGDLPSTDTPIGDSPLK